MKKHLPLFPLITFVFSVMIFASLALVSSSFAYNQCKYVYEALLDTDNNENTGGAVGVVQGTEAPHNIPGIDYRVQVDLDICQASNHLGPTHILQWNGSGFVVHSTNTDTYNIGKMQGDLFDGIHNSDLIEFKALKSDIGNPQGSMKVVYHAMSNVAFDNDYTGPFHDPPLSASIPTLTQWGMIILSVLFGLIAFLIMRKRNSAIMRILPSFLIVLSIVGIVSANFTCPEIICLDGLVEDWNEISATPSITDPVGDSSANDAGEDIYLGYITRDNDYIYFRIDIVGGCQINMTLDSYYPTYNELDLMNVVATIIDTNGANYTPIISGALPDGIGSTTDTNLATISGTISEIACDPNVSCPFSNIITAGTPIGGGCQTTINYAVIGMNTPP